MHEASSLLWNQLLHQLHMLRLRRGWSLEELAKQAGVSRTTLYYLTQGNISRPRWKTLQKLASALGCELPLDGQPGTSSPVDLVRNPSPTKHEHTEDVTDNPITPDQQDFDRLTNSQIQALSQSEPELFAGWTSHDWTELYSTMGMGGALNSEGVRQEASRISRKKTTLRHLEIVLETHLSDVASAVIETLYQQVQISEPPPSAPAVELGWSPPQRSTPPGLRHR